MILIYNCNHVRSNLNSRAAWNKPKAGQALRLAAGLLLAAPLAHAAYRTQQAASLYFRRGALSARLSTLIISCVNKRFEYQELIFDGKVAKGYKVGVRMQDGRVVRRDYFHYEGAAVVLPILDDGRIVMIRNYRFAVDEHLYELPAGMLNEGEDPIGCAARELTEETGYTAARIEKLGQFYTGPGTTDELMHAYLATGLSDGRQNLEAYEQITVETFSEDEIRQMVASGEIHDGKTIATLGLYWLKKN